MKSLVNVIGEYFKNLDSSLDKLSKNKEGKVTNLPSWTLTSRDITVAFTPDIKGVVVRVEPNHTIDNDRVHKQILVNKQNFHKLLSPWKPNFGMNELGRTPFNLIGDPTLVSQDNPLAEPVFEGRYLLGYGNVNSAINVFSDENAKTDALNFWNIAIYDLESTGSFIHETKIVLSKFQRIIKRKSFLERRIHRFINEHRKLLLPNYSCCYFEHKLYLNDEMRKADFILEREFGMHNPGEIVHQIRSMSSTKSEVNRPLIPEHVVHFLGSPRIDGRHQTESCT